MSLRKLSGAAAAGSRHSYATAGSVVSSSAGGAETAGAGQTSAGGAPSGGSGTVASSKGYSSHLAVQSEATKYRGKYKELKKKVRQIEGENDRLHLKTLRIKRNIQRMRLERAILYERLEAELNMSGGGPEHSVIPSAVATVDEEFVRQSPVSRTAGPAAIRRNIDFSPSPEEERGSNGGHQQTKKEQHANGGAAASTTTTTTTTTTPKSGEQQQPGRASIKITLKRSHNSSNSTKEQHNV